MFLAFTPPHPGDFEQAAWCSYQWNRKRIANADRALYWRDPELARARKREHYRTRCESDPAKMREQAKLKRRGWYEKIKADPVRYRAWLDNHNARRRGRERSH